MHAKDMKQQVITHVFIDAANLHKGVRSSGWHLDYARFRVWLSDKYAAERVYLFIGLVPKQKALYTALQEAGFTLVFKETTRDGDGKVKGNCDAELVLHATIGYFEKRYEKAVIVSSDGDYACLVEFLKNRKAFEVLLSPHDKSSFLLRKLDIPIVYLSTQRSNLEQKEKAPNEDGTSSGSSSWV